MRVVNSNTSISAEKIVEKPDFSNLPEINRPVMNPDLERWILLIAELGHPDTPDKELIYKLYFFFHVERACESKVFNSNEGRQRYAKSRRKWQGGN